MSLWIDSLKFLDRGDQHLEKSAGVHTAHRNRASKPGLGESSLCLLLLSLLIVLPPGLSPGVRELLLLTVSVTLEACTLFYAHPD